jgi:hypothetical protein
MKSSQWCVPLGISPADHQQPRLRGAVGGRQHHQPARRQPAGKRCHEGGFVGDMFDHFHCGDQVEAADIQRADLARDIADIETRAFGMHRCSRGVFGRGIDAGDIRPQPRQRFAQQSGTAADIQRGLARERLARLDVACPVQVDRLAQELQPHGIEPVEHGRRALGVPPVLGQPAEMRGFVGADRCARNCAGRSIATRLCGCIAHALWLAA